MRNSNITRSLATVVLAATVMIGLGACSNGSDPRPAPSTPSVTGSTPTSAPTTAAPSKSSGTDTVGDGSSPVTKPHGDVDGRYVWGSVAKVGSTGSDVPNSQIRTYYLADQMPAGSYLIQPYKLEAGRFAGKHVACYVSWYDKVSWGTGNQMGTARSSDDGSDVVVTIPAKTYVVTTSCELRTGDQTVLSKVTTQPTGSTTPPPAD